MSEENTKPTFSIKALQSGDRAEFARMMDHFSNPIYRLGLKILGDEQDAEDILQETFIKAYRSIEKFEGRSSLSTWLYRIATNEALMLLRKRKPGLDLVLESDDDDDIEPREIVDWCCLPEEEMLSTESRSFLETAVQVLSTPLRLVFLMRDVERMSIKETAEILEISESAVKVRLMRARLKLREELTHYFGAQLDGKEVQNA
jgi:RNA polymerase sigma-70 factor, ECF subfamily